MPRVVLALVAFLAVVVGSATARADDVFIYVGTVTALDAAMTRVTVTWTEDGQDLSDVLAISPSTSFTRDGVGVARSALQVGATVTVLAVENPYVALDVLEATDILLGREDVRAIFE